MRWASILRAGLVLGLAASHAPASEEIAVEEDIADEEKGLVYLALGHTF